MSRGRVVARVLAFCAVTVAMIALAPVIVLVGEPLRTFYLRRLSRPRSRSASARALARAVIANPVLIALTAPGRWAIGQVGGMRSGGSGDGDWPPPAGVREPRQPRPNAPAGAIALAEPKQRHRTIPILKALPLALSEPVHRCRSRLARISSALRATVSRRLLQRPRPTPAD